MENKNCYYFELSHINIFMYIIYFNLFMSYFTCPLTKSYMPSLFCRLSYVYEGVKLYLFPKTPKLNAYDTFLLVVDMV